MNFALGITFPGSASALWVDMHCALQVAKAVLEEIRLRTGKVFLEERKFS